MNDVDKIKKSVLQIIWDVKNTSGTEYIEHMNLSSQGIDSLDMFDVLLGLEERYQIKINESDIDEQEWNTIDKIASQVKMRLT